MQEFLDRFSLDAIKFDNTVLACMILIWLVVVGCSINSIKQQDFAPKREKLWILGVILLPIIGVLAYLPFSFKLENYPDLFIWKKNLGKARD